MFDIVAIPAFSDNYIWLLLRNGRAAVVDPGDATVVMQALDQRALKLDRILLTHHHTDHIGGVDALVTRYACPVIGPAHDSIDQISQPVGDGENIEVLGANFKVIDVPGHTRGHIAYWCADEGVLFCGDTLFAAGCGRLFEGTPLQMWTSLSRLASLPSATRVYCAHEYTLANLRFALTVEPHNRALIARNENVEAMRARGLASVPFMLAEEFATNPFLRSAETDVAAHAEMLARRPEIALRIPADADLAGPARTFAILRAAKDGFK